MKLHLGCGKRHIHGFVHIDVVDYPHVDHVSSIDSLPFIPDNSVDLIYNCHVLEHFKRRDVERVLQEWYRVLRPGGVLRISVPDFAKLCEVYQLYGKIDLVIGALFGRQDYLYNIHYNVFDFPYLADVLQKTGFGHVHHYDWRQTEHADIDDFSQAYIPHMDKEHGTLISLNVECKKMQTVI
ncbi:class I SAM-dependent methyltransferase [Thiovibrio frasassiensis]|uniref:Methyltransferase domain-containing protein n=1 Tax=Thiovibrio frasassiensis TaxID=2984131 RepID=A0A9X4RQ93_9BACT|nr:methyltransferase domain-containing protein [Thiovibrio frasassiensis]MDG4476032.1 methyltransferase domain-containing protein [Thiovibrio frasassiensis]